MSTSFLEGSSQKTRSTHRRMPSEFGHAATEQTTSIDEPYVFRSNRASAQTALTEAPTESTFSPHTPIDTAETHGLAPRPPSFQQRSGQDHTLASSQRRPQPMHTYGTEPHVAMELGSGPPEAPDVPRGPPVSYRHPYVDPRSPTYITPADPKRDPKQLEEPESYSYTGRNNPSAVNRLPFQNDGMQYKVVEGAERRRPSITGASDRRKKLIAERSPLQRLELTLDSLTKEEKRARMEAAEQRARQRAARNAMPSKDSTAFQPISSPPKETGPVSDAFASFLSTVLPQDSAPRVSPPPSQAAITTNSTGASGYAESEDQRGDLQSGKVSRAVNHGIPTRNLSFRDRASRTDAVSPSARAAVELNDAAAAIRSNIPLIRSGSNKLRKEPPLQTRHYQDDHIARRSSTSDAYPTQSSNPPPHKPLLRAAQDKELPPLPISAPAEARRIPPATTKYGAVGSTMQSYATQNAVLVGLPEMEKPSQSEDSPHSTDASIDRQEVPRIIPDNTAAARKHLERHDSGSSLDSHQHHHHISNLLYKSPAEFLPGEGLYKPPQWLDEWKKATIGNLSGKYLDVHEPMASDSYKAWWEEGGSRRSNNSASQRRKAEAFDGEYEDTNAPTRFKPPLFLKCGPLIRYCGLRREAHSTKPSRSGSVAERQIWRGSVMIITKDSESSYEIAPMLRLFVQDIELLPSPPHKVDGELPADYVDPIAGHPKLGRRGETLYVRPVEHLEESKDLSQTETDEGLFEKRRSPPDYLSGNASAELAGSFFSRRKRIETDGEKVQKYKDVRGFRLHTEQGCTFWRFNLEIGLRDNQQRIAYRINRGPCMSFWVPARDQTMSMMFYSCNGFSASVKPDDFSGPDPMWRDVLNTHQSKPFHVMIGGGDQIYNDCVANECSLFGEWLDIRNPFHKHTAPFTPDLQSELEDFYFERYCMWFSQGLFSLATSQIPMVNMYDDHDVFDGYGSYPHHDMKAPVFSGLGAVAFKYYMLFQHQTVLTETENTEPSWILGINPGPYIKELSRSVFVSLGGKAALLALDCRTERTEHDIIDEKSWDKITNRLYSEVRHGQLDHLLVLVGVPVAYPRLVWLENILTSRLMTPVKALGKTGILGKVLNNIDGGVEVLDDLNDHWTAKNHKHERSIVIEDLQDLAMDKSVRITLLSGDVHLAAVGQFVSNPQLGLPKHADPRYMPNIISSAIVNTPPPDLMADVLNKRNKVHHFDRQTDEEMIPIFQHGVDGKPRNNKRLLPHRNWCSIRLWSPGSTPPPTPPISVYDRSPSPPPSGRGGVLRRFSQSKASHGRPDESRESMTAPRPPISKGGLFRSLTRKNSVGAPPQSQPSKLTRAMSVGRDAEPGRGLFRFIRRPSQSRANDGGINGQWGSNSDEDAYSDYRNNERPRPTGLRGGGGNDEFSIGDEAHFSPLPPRRSQTLGNLPGSQTEGPSIRPFHRTPTGLSAKQMKQPQQYEVDLEGGLDICINVEVNPKDPTGITVPYRLLVPRLRYKYQPGDDKVPAAHPSGFKRLISFKKRPTVSQRAKAEEEPENYDEDQSDAEEEAGRH